MEGAISSDQLLNLILLGILIMLAFALAFILYFLISRRRLILAHKLSKKMQLRHQEELLQNNILVQEKERQRIAQDLHDEIGSKLNVIKLYLHQLQKTDQSGQFFTELIGDMDSVLHKAIQSTVSISHSLLPPTLNSFGLFTAIEELVEEVNASNKLDIDLQVLGEEKLRFEKIVEINLFRVLQELISNSLKQNVSKMLIKMNLSPEGLEIDFEDNGPGYTPSAPEHQKGMGLRNIDSRLKMIGATWQNLSELGKSAKYLIHLKTS